MDFYCCNYYPINEYYNNYYLPNNSKSLFEKKSFNNNNYCLQNNRKEINGSYDEINLMKLNMKIELLNSKINQMNDAFSQINFNYLDNQKDKLKRQINLFHYNDKGKVLTYQFENNFDDNKTEELNNNCSNNNINNNQLKIINSNKRKNINSISNKYNDLSSPFLLSSNQSKEMSRNNNSSKKRIIKNTFQKDQNYNYNISNNYSVQENNNDNNTKNTLNLNYSNNCKFGSYDSYFIESKTNTKNTGQNSENTDMKTISIEKEKNNKRPKIISPTNINNNFYFNKDNKYEDNTIYSEKINNTENNSSNDDNKKIKDYNNYQEGNNDNKNFIIKQKPKSENNENQDFNLNKKGDVGNLGNKTTKKFSLLNKLSQLGKKNEYKDRIENENRSIQNNLKDKGNNLITSDNYNNKKIIIFNNYDKNSSNKINYKSNENIENNNLKKEEILKDNISYIKKKSNKRLSIHEEENITIKYNEKDEITKILIYDALDREKRFIPKNINVYFSKLKRFRPQSVLLNSNIKIKYKDYKNNNKKRKKLNNKKRKLLQNKNEDKKIIKSKSASSLNSSIYKRNKFKNNLNIKNKQLKNNSNDSKRIPTKKEICEKFKKNPQFFYTENLCDLVIKSFDFSTADENKENFNKFNGAVNDNKNNVQKIVIDKKINMEAYFNLKKFFKENNLDED